MASKKWDSFTPKWEKIQSYLLSVETNNEDLKVTQKSRINEKDKLEAFRKGESGELCQHIWHRSVTFNVDNSSIFQLTKV